MVLVHNLKLNIIKICCSLAKALVTNTWHVHWGDREDETFMGGVRWTWTTWCVTEGTFNSCFAWNKHHDRVDQNNNWMRLTVDMFILYQKTRVAICILGKMYRLVHPIEISCCLHLHEFYMMYRDEGFLLMFNVVSMDWNSTPTPQAIEGQEVAAVSEELRQMRRRRQLAFLWCKAGAKIW